MEVVHECALSLRGLTEQCRHHMPPHILQMKEPHIHVAFVAACVAACGLPDADLHIDCALGFKMVGEVLYSGMFRKDDEPHHPASYESLQHDPFMCGDAWNNRIDMQVRRAQADPTQAEANAIVWAATAKEAEEGWIRGPFTRARIRAIFPAGYRALRRFGVEQKGGSAPLRRRQG